MPEQHVDTASYWIETTSFPEFPKLSRDLAADVVVVGAGITGLTTAYWLARSGKQVVVLERERCASGDSGYTSAHLTMVTDARLSELATHFGRDKAKAVWDGGIAAIATIADVVRTHGIDAGFEWLDGYLHAPQAGDADRDVARLAEDATLARDLGFEAKFIDDVPFVNRPGICFPDQARFQPRAYLAGIAQALVKSGGRIFEHSTADEFIEDPRAVRVANHTVRCEDIVIATHSPLAGLNGSTDATLLQTKLALYTSYVIAGRVPHGTVPDALWWDTASPYHYLRVEPHPEFDMVIFGGADHKTGQRGDTETCYRALDATLGAILPRVDLTHRWSAQVIETPDGLPYIGQTAPHQYVATGYGGNGLTFGTLAGLMISDTILGRSNQWSELFDPGRTVLTHGLWTYLKENVDYPYYMIRDRLAGPDAEPLTEVKRGQGQVIERNGEKVAVYRDPEGAVTVRSAICTHMGCTVEWNEAEHTWDCPCHGSRFKPTGDVISGPAQSPLAAVE